MRKLPFTPLPVDPTFAGWYTTLGVDVEGIPDADLPDNYPYASGLAQYDCRKDDWFSHIMLTMVVTLVVVYIIAHWGEPVRVGELPAQAQVQEVQHAN